MAYTSFHDRCGDIERRFGRQGHLPLRRLDLEVVRCNRLLDFGSGKGLNAGLCTEYYTLDSDASLGPSFTSLDEARTSHVTFDAVVANQVLEHVPADQIGLVMDDITSMMCPGAVFLATIPNVHRGSYYFNDIDHKTPLMYYHVGAFLEGAGLIVIDAYRYTKDHEALAALDDATRHLVGLLQKLYELDPAQFIAIVARK